MCFTRSSYSLSTPRNLRLIQSAPSWNRCLSSSPLLISPCYSHLIRLTWECSFRFSRSISSSYTLFYLELRPPILSYASMLDVFPGALIIILFFLTLKALRARLAFCDSLSEPASMTLSTCWFPACSCINRAAVSSQAVCAVPSPPHCTRYALSLFVFFLSPAISYSAQLAAYWPLYQWAPSRAPFWSHSLFCRLSEGSTHLLHCNLS